MRGILLMLVASSIAAAAFAERGRYLDPDSFIDQALQGAPHEAGVVWIDAELRTRIEDVLGHAFPLLRVRYWQAGETTAWILDEIGKEEPITIGVSIESDRVDLVRILEFRESRGWEVKYPFFTAQFDGARLATDADGLDRRIDGISGATLSVRAVSRVVETALLLNSHVAGSKVGDFASVAAR